MGKMIETSATPSKGRLRLEENTRNCQKSYYHISETNFWKFLVISSDKKTRGERPSGLFLTSFS